MIVGDTWAEVHYEICKVFSGSGTPGPFDTTRILTVSPRGMKTREILGAHFSIRNPLSRLAYHPQRRFNLMYAIVEAVLLFTDTDDLKYFEKFNPQMSQFSDDGEKLYGAYGARLWDKWQQLIFKLQKDPDTRQAVVTIVRPMDLFATTRNFPCTVSLHFLIREGKLDLHVNMRSNDFLLGTPYDVFNFTCAQEAVALALGIGVGQYYHSATSLHVYEREPYAERFYDFAWMDINDPSSMAYTKPITFRHGNDIEGMKRVFRLYDLLYFQDGALLSSNDEKDPFSRLLLNEHWHRDGRNELIRKTPEWAKDFTKRWLS